MEASIAGISVWGRRPGEEPFVIRVAIGQPQYRGIVIAAIDDRSYLPGGEDREYLGCGAMIDTDFGGLVHY